MDTKKVVAVIALLAVLSTVAFAVADSTDSSASGKEGEGSGDGISVDYHTASTGEGVMDVTLSNASDEVIVIVDGTSYRVPVTGNVASIVLDRPLDKDTYTVSVNDKLGKPIASCDNLVVYDYYDVTLKPGDGTGTDIKEQVKETVGTYTLPECSFTAPTDKVFDAWSVGGETKAAGSTIAVTADVTVTALWKEIVHVTGVTLDITSLTLKVGDYKALTATVSPANADTKTVTWKSSSDSVTVSANGVVKAIKEGTATITVTTEDGNKTATCAVTVTAAPTPPTPPTPTVIPVTGVTLDKATAAMDVGETETLRATVSPSNATDKTVIWKSSNESVATVSTNGVVTALKAGTTTITVTTNDGNKTATCAVTVTAAPGPTVPVTGVILDKETATAEVGKTVTLTATISPSNATNKAVTWRSSDSSVATVSANGVVTAIKEGTATITVTTSDGGKVDTCVMTVTEPEPQPENGDGDDNTLLYIVIAIIVVIVVIGVVVYFVKFR